MSRPITSLRKKISSSSREPLDLIQNRSLSYTNLLLALLKGGNQLGRCRCRCAQEMALSKTAVTCVHKYSTDMKKNALARLRDSQPSPHIFLHVCTCTKMCWFLSQEVRENRAFFVPSPREFPLSVCHSKFFKILHILVVARYKFTSTKWQVARSANSYYVENVVG